MDDSTRRSARAVRRGVDVHQTHFFYAEDLASGATVRDHVTGEVVGEVDRVGRHVFEGYGAPAPDGGTPGDLVVEVRELEVPEPVGRPETVETPGPTRPTRPTEATEPTEPPPVPGDEQERTDGQERTDDPAAPAAPVTEDDAKRTDRAALGASVAQGVAIAVLAPLLALALLVLLLVLLVG